MMEGTSHDTIGYSLAQGRLCISEKTSFLAITPPGFECGPPNPQKYKTIISMTEDNNYFVMLGALILSHCWIYLQFGSVISNIYYLLLILFFKSSGNQN